MKFSLIQSPTHIELVAGASGSLLIFEGAILARAEVNKNRDEILPEGIDQLAASIGGKAIDIEHDMAANCGIFTGGVAVDDPALGRVLSTSGIIWADRYPEQAAGIQAGTHGLSVEADGQLATCSVCGGQFDNSDVYCKHLRNRRESGAKRTVTDLVASGGAVTRRPAGNGTDFSQAQLRFVARHLEADPPAAHASPTQPAAVPLVAQEARMKTCPYCAKETVEGACPAGHVLTAEALAPDLASALTKLSTLGKENETLAAQAATEKNERTTAEAASLAALAEKETALTAAQTAMQTLTAQLRRTKMGARMTDADWEKKAPTLLAMADAAFDLTVELATAPAAPGGIRLDAESGKSGETTVPAHVAIEL